jgi:hypothetical protein
MNKYLKFIKKIKLHDTDYWIERIKKKNLSNIQKIYKIWNR